MSEKRAGIKLDFVSDIPNLPSRPKVDPLTTASSVVAAQEVGFISEAGKKPAANQLGKIDGRRLRRRAMKVQLNLKITPEEKEDILAEAELFLQNQSTNIRTVGEFVVHIVDLYKKQKN